MGFTGFYRVILGSIWFHWVLLGLWRILHDEIRFHKVLLSVTGFDWVSPSSNGFHRVSL